MDKDRVRWAAEKAARQDPATAVCLRKGCGQSIAGADRQAVYWNARAHLHAAHT